MKIVGYIRVSSDKQDYDNQKHLLLQYAQVHQILIDEFIKVEISSKKNTKERKIDELISRLKKGDVLLVTELSRFGRNMFQTLNIINGMSEKGISIIFVNQPELSTTGPHTKLLLAIYSYFAEAEREYISMRTKQGLAAARAKGKKLGRPKGSKNKERVLDPYKDQMISYLKIHLNLASIMKIVNNQLQKSISYNSFKYFVRHDEDLYNAWKSQKENITEKG